MTTTPESVEMLEIVGRTQCPACKGLDERSGEWVDDAAVWSGADGGHYGDCPVCGHSWKLATR